LPTATTTRLAAVISNDGSAPWPAFGMVPRHLVRLHACVTRADLPCASLPIALLADVLPGKPVTASFEIPTPMLAGSYVLELSLIQVGDPPLADCGVAALRLPVSAWPTSPSPGHTP
jgi:hypothetical protein